jgi:hypothetical protein
MYGRLGYIPIDRYNDNPYADRWFEKSLAPRREPTGYDVAARNTSAGGVNRVDRPDEREVDDHLVDAARNDGRDVVGGLVLHRDDHAIAGIATRVVADHLAKAVALGLVR